MRNTYRLILGFGIIAFTLLSLQIANTKQTTVGEPPLTDNILRSKIAFAVVGEEINRGLNLHTLSESDYWKLRGPVLLEQQTDIHFLLREQYGRIVNTVYFGAALDAGSPSQNPSIRPENKPVLYQKASEIIRDFITQKDISVIIRSHAPIGIGEIAAIRRLQGEVPYTYEIINSAAVSVPLKNIAALIKLPFITEIWPDRKGHLQQLPQNVQKIGADKVHEQPPNGLGVTGKGVLVGVVDNGMTWDHDGAIKKIDPWIDRSRVQGIRPTIQREDRDHGIVVARVIGGALHNNKIGVAPEVRFVDARRGYALAIGDGDYKDAMQALKWASDTDTDIINFGDQQADVINLSRSWEPWVYGRSADDPMSKLIETLVEKNGIVVVNAAGNWARQRASGQINSTSNTNTHAFTVSKDISVKVTLLWDNKTNDLDLAVSGSSNTPIKSQGETSYGVKKLYEEVKFDAQVNNTYTVEVQAVGQNFSSPQAYEIWLHGEDREDRYVPEFTSPDREKTVGVPGYSPKVITVGAVSPGTSKITTYSSAGPSDTGLIKPEVVAPGTVYLTDGTSYQTKGGFAPGTSFAAPHVSGVAALILDAVGKNSAGEWNFSPAEVKSAIVRGAERGGQITLTPIILPLSPIPQAPDNEYGAGLVRADKIIFGDEVQPGATKRFRITPDLLQSQFIGVGYLNAENRYPNTTSSHVDFSVAISWGNNGEVFPLAPTPGTTIPQTAPPLELKLLNTHFKTIVQSSGGSNQYTQGSNYVKITGFPLPTNLNRNDYLYLDVHNPKGNAPIRFTGASTQPIEPFVVAIPSKVRPTHTTTTAPPQGTSVLNLPKDATARFGKGNIHHIAYSPDGTLLATAGRVGVWLYDAKTYQAVGLLRGHRYGVSTLAFSPDGKTLATGNRLYGTANTVRLWDVATRTEKNRLTIGGVYDVAFSRDGKTLATTDDRDEVRLWDVDTGTEKNPLPTRSVDRVAFSPDGKTIATTYGGALVRLWSVSFGVEMKVFTGYNGNIRSIAFSPDGKTIAGGGSDNTVRLWDVDTGETTHRLRGHTREVRSITFSPDGKTIATGSRDETVRLWDIKTGETKHTLTGSTFQGYYVEYPENDTVTFSSDGKTVASVDLDFTVRLWDVETGTQKKTLPRPTLAVYSLAFSPDGKTLASGEMDHTDNNITVRLWDVDTRTTKKTLTGHAYLVYGVAFSPDGNTLATAGNDKTVRLWDVDTGAEKKTLIEHYQSPAWSVAFSPDGKILASGGPGAAHLWDVKTGESTHTLPHRWSPVRSVAFSLDGKTIATGGIQSRGGEVHLWDVETGENKQTLPLYAYSVAFSPDGKTIAAGGDRGNASLWNLAFDEIKHTFTVSTDTYYRPPPVYTVAFSPDGNTLATGGGTATGDGTVLLWDVKTGENKHTLTGHTATVRSVAFNSDGTTLASGSEDGTVLLWNVTPYTVEPPAPEYPPWDVNQDGKVNIVDVVSVSHYLGEPASASPRADVNGDGIINILDLLLVSKHIDESTDAAAPVRIAKLEGLDRTTVEGWLALARIEDDGSLVFQEGIAYLERLLAALTPKETALLANYPNPFNPETWIPYQLAKPADVKLTIYDIKGRVVRDLDLGHQRAGMY
ncbi:S8 family serine peptidase, partial [Candidatus Poribacteria bacterium]|nr:S8 family serine peptidase [Candidatus Poribacteria bacterium]